jgi:magnesium chelatase family protein
MFCSIKSATTIGIESAVIEVEVDAKKGLPHQSIVGLPDTAVREARERVCSAIRNSGFEFPLGKLTINLAPADLKKEGSTFDLAIALGILIASGQLDSAHIVVNDFIVLGELSLNGQVRPVRGTLAIAENAKRRGIRDIVLPAANSREALLISDMRIHPVRCLREAAEVLSCGNHAGIAQADPAASHQVPAADNGLDFSEIRGQSYAVRAAEIAAAGGHNLLLVGSPGSGKTMIATRIPTILPPMSEKESIETTKIYSAAGLTASSEGLMSARPFRAPHHTASDMSIIGGGKNPIPGEITLAHNGVLFLDEFTEFRNSIIQSLRQPMETGTITIARADMRVTYPALFMLVASMNPCPCGFFFETEQRCRCTPVQLGRYYTKLSGPILDRIDIQVEVKPLAPFEIIKGESAPESRQIRSRVAKARELQRDRLVPFGVRLNARMNEDLVKRFCVVSREMQGLLYAAVKRYGLSVRSYHKILRVARTIADIEERSDLCLQDILEALSYRDVGNRFYGSSIPRHHTIL